MIVIYFPDGSSIKLTTGIERGHRDVIQVKVSILSFKNLCNLASFASYSQEEYSNYPNNKNANLILGSFRAGSLFQNNKGRLSQIRKESNIVYMHYECS